MNENLVRKPTGEKTALISLQDLHWCGVHDWSFNPHEGTESWGEGQTAVDYHEPAMCIGCVVTAGGDSSGWEYSVGDKQHYNQKEVWKPSKNKGQGATDPTRI